MSLGAWPSSNPYAVRPANVGTMALNTSPHHSQPRKRKSALSEGYSSDNANQKVNINSKSQAPLHSAEAQTRMKKWALKLAAMKDKLLSLRHSRGDANIGNYAGFESYEHSQLQKRKDSSGTTQTSSTDSTLVDTTIDQVPVVLPKADSTDDDLVKSKEEFFSRQRKLTGVSSPKRHYRSRRRYSRLSETEDERAVRLAAKDERKHERWALWAGMRFDHNAHPQVRDLGCQGQYWGWWGFAGMYM